MARLSPLESGDGTTEVIYHDDALEPRGLAMRADTDPRTSTILDDSAAPRRAAGGTAALLAAAAAALAVGRRRMRL